ncbi:MAG: tRNA-dependent cyclodipeptide synthase [Micavibrio sp.]
MLQTAFRDTYPPQTGLYAIKIKSGDDWKAHDACRLHISVGQQYHEGAKFQATTDWARNRFKTVIVCVNDALQLGNMMFERGIDRSEAYVRSIKAGDEWIERNASALQGVEVRRWESWKTWPDFFKAMEGVVATYEQNKDFAGAIDRTASNFWERRERLNLAYTPDKKGEFLRLSRDYLLEEVAVICRMIDQKRAIDIYPGTMLPVFDIMKGNPLPYAPASLSQRDFARIDFAKRTPANA